MPRTKISESFQGFSVLPTVLDAFKALWSFIQDFLNGQLERIAISVVFFTEASAFSGKQAGACYIVSQFFKL
jgi:hypothetical protein